MKNRHMFVFVSQDTPVETVKKVHIQTREYSFLDNFLKKA
jgi:hypothetical protein